MTYIFNNQVNNLVLTSENIISYNSFYNIINNTLANFTSLVILYESNFPLIISNLYEIIYKNINNTILPIINFFGGTNNMGISLNNSNLNNVFNVNNYKNENSQITAFTLVFKQINNGIIDDNVLIIFFYYICFITWSTLGTNTGYSTYNIQEIFYGLTNLINKQIIEYVNLLDKNKFTNTNAYTYDDINNNSVTNNVYYFFDYLNILLFKKYHDNEFIKATELFFENIRLNYLPNTTIYNLYEISNPNALNIFDNIINNSSNLSNINNSIKIRNWKCLLGLYTDYNDYSDYSYEDDSYCESDEEYERHMECRIEWLRDIWLGK
jgi:hypothetical protein